MPILARLTNFYDFYDFRKAVATAFLGISKIPIVNVEIHSFLLFVQKCLFSSDTNLSRKKLNSGYKLKDVSAMLLEAALAAYSQKYSIVYFADTYLSQLVYDSFCVYDETFGFQVEFKAVSCLFEVSK